MIWLCWTGETQFSTEEISRFRAGEAVGKVICPPAYRVDVHENQGDEVRIGIAAGRSLGMAVQRNRAKRMIRAALQSMLKRIHPGHDLILIARHPLLEADFQKLQEALLILLHRAQILKANDV